MSGEDGAAAGGADMSIIDTLPSAVSLMAEGTAALSKAIVETLKHQVESSTAELKTLEKVNHVVGGQYSEVKDNLGDLQAFYAEYQAHVAALQPHLDQIDVLDKVVRQLEESAQTLDAQTTQLENSIADVLS